MPWLSSALARAGVAVLVGLSVAVGFHYWAVTRDDAQLAWITVAAETIAFAGLAFVRGVWRTQWGWALVAVVLTLVAASWCGLTMAEKIAADGRAGALKAAQATLPYRLAAQDLQEASTALRAVLAEPQPTCACPDTRAAWSVAQTQMAANLTRARDNAQARLERAVPAPAPDPLAYIRGAGVELLKLFGFAAFGLAAGREKARPWWRFWGASLATSVALGAPASAPDSPAPPYIGAPDAAPQAQVEAQVETHPRAQVEAHPAPPRRARAKRGWVDPARVAEAQRLLLAHTASDRAIARTVGLSATTVHRLRRGLTPLGGGAGKL